MGLSIALNRVCRFAWRRPRLSALVLVLFTVTCFSSLKHLKFVFSAQDMVGEGIPSADELNAINDRYSDAVNSTLFITPPAGASSFSPEELCAIRKWYSVVRSTDPSFKNSASTFDVMWPAKLGARTVKWQDVMQLDCDRKIALRPLSEVKAMLESSPWASLKDHGTRLSLIFTFRFNEPENSKFGSFDPKELQPLRDSVEHELKVIIPRAKMSWVGPADYQWYVKQGYSFSLYVNTAMLLVLLLSLRFCYGTWTAGLIYCTTLIAAGVWIYGLKALMGSPYDVLSSGLFLIFGVSALEDFTFLSAEQFRTGSWKKAVRTMLVPSFFTSLTTMLGFISLGVSDMVIIRRFGVWCAVGALLEWFLLFGMIPAILPLFYKRPTWVDAKRALVPESTHRWVSKAMPRWVSWACLAVFPLALYSFPRLNANDSPSGAFPKSHPYNLALQDLRDAKGWQSTVSLLWDGKPEEGERALDEVADGLVADPVLHGSVAAYESPKRVLDWFSKDQVLPRDVLHEDFSLSLQYKQLVDHDGIPRATLFIRDTSVEALQALKAEAAKLCGGRCHSGGDLIAYSDFATLIPKTLIDSMAMSLFLVAAIVAYLALAFGKARKLPVFLASSFWGPCLMICALAALGIPMDFQKSIFASVLVGLTGDNVVQYLFAAGSDELSKGVERRGIASIHTNLFMALTSLMYLLSYFSPPKVFGLILASGLIASLIGDLWLLNGLM